MEIPSDIDKTRYLAVAKDSERITFWDRENKTVWLFSKQGEFLARQPVEVEDVGGLAISPDGTEAYLFGTGKIYRVKFSV
jgi:hypothetical protein